MGIVQSAFVISDIDQAIGETLRRMAIVDKATNYTVTTSDFFIRCTANGIQITLPPAADFWDAINGRGSDLMIAKKLAAFGIITIAADGVEVINNFGEKDNTVTIDEEDDTLHLVSNGTSWDII